MSNQRTRRGRAAFSLVEILVAIALLGVAAAGLAVALAADRRARDLAAAHAATADRAREHLEALASRSCGADTAETTSGSWGTESWRAVAGSGAWHLTDSLVPRQSRAPLVIEAFVACPE